MPHLVIHPGHDGTATRTPYGFRTTDHPRLDKLQNAISAVCTWIAGAAIILLVLITAAEVFMREVLSHPLGWNISLTEKYLLPTIAFFGLIVAYRTSTHIAVETIFTKLPRPVQKIILVLIHASVAFSMVMLALAGWNETWMAFSLHHQTLPGMADLPLPDWTFRAIVPCAAILCAFLAAIDFYREVTTPWHRPFTDYDPGEEGH
ncbi:TRAP transporter small permease [Corynebacterium sp. 320]|uniref:TRAP transporter small permease n=1 Tax=Corynebacterium TaxID=1716 RepID=UPI00125CB896|nr:MULTISPECIES: TRAP transporter small permease [Corynebacterium]KAB1503127.1 TRAP transporter small permease [Corynebacterium sp. 320]KAB1550659.1 TRAP transporter small permease [Corynebacterium sp. 321]KAB1551021.1 TRAP transporter small permease [Corynebacterium sp. 319]KAB3526924.1 TRAP transporter small permease [Corynebacterium sp. 250]KAB3538417.1 TRAP transporter small permease [Corynebacterium sp. 366]